MHGLLVTLIYATITAYKVYFPSSLPDRCDAIPSVAPSFFVLQLSRLKCSLICAHRTCCWFRWDKSNQSCLIAVPHGGGIPENPVAMTEEFRRAELEWPCPLRVNGSSFVVLQRKVTWSQAKRFCVQRYAAHLAEVDTVVKLETFIEKIAENYSGKLGSFS